MQNDVGHGASPAAQRFEAMIARLVNPSDPTPKQTPETPDVKSQAYFLLQPAMSGGKVSYDDCKRTDDPSLIPDLKKGDMVEMKSDGASFTYYYDTLSGAFGKQLEYQASAVALEGKRRSIFYCIGNQTDADFLARKYMKTYKNIFFAVCH